ncbi:MAG: tetratricopeptide repeat protein [Acidimicrobiales bacterium]
MADRQLPQGSVTFLFTDVEGSTQLFRQLDVRYPPLLRRHHQVLSSSFSRFGGVVVDTEGDGCFAAFDDAFAAVQAAAAAQIGLGLIDAELEDATLRVRMGLHTGSAVPVGGTYTALAVHRAARVSASAHGGQVVLSASTLEAATSRIAADPDLSILDLGAYSLKDFPDPEHLFQVIHPELLREFPPLRARSPRLHNLPVSRTSFIGREGDKRDVKKLLQNDHMVTIVGPGGAGKTRLSIEVAGDVAPEFSDGAWLVELGGLTDPNLVPSAVAQAIGIRSEADRDMSDALCEGIGDRSLLLLLDNCEHLLDACAQLADAVLRSCASVKILATSRERIGIPDEVVWSIPSLGVPPPGELESSDLVSHDAVRLFCDRAAHTFPDFTFDARSVSAVAEICRRLDGIPLAIELAAARVGSLTPQEIATLLDDRFELLDGGNRAALARHRTLRAALEWSFELLSPDERLLFNRLGIFAGSWSIEAANAICSSSGSVIRTLAHLSQCSLVVRTMTEDGQTRFSMLETVRELAWRHLEESQDLAEMRVAHLEWFRSIASDSDLEGGAQRKWLDLLTADQENLRNALEFALDDRRSDVALEMAAQLAPFWRVHGDVVEGLDWLERALAQSNSLSRDRAAALLGAGGLMVMNGDYRKARSTLEESARLSNQLEDQHGAARTTLDLAWVAWHEGDVFEAARQLASYLEILKDTGDGKGLADAHRMAGVIAAERHDLEVATEHLEEALSIFERIGDLLGAGSALMSLGITAEYRGDLLAACDLMEQSLTKAREAGDPRRIAGALDNLGFFWQQRGDLDRARDLHSESLETFRSIGDRSHLAAALTNLGSTARQQGSLEEARSLLTESLTIARDTEDRSRDVADVLEELAALDVAEGHFDRGLLLFASAEQIRDAVGYPLRAFFRGMYDPLIEVARSQSADHQGHWARGRTIGIDDAIVMALGEA